MPPERLRPAPAGASSASVADLIAPRPKLRTVERPLRRVVFFGKSMSRTRCTGALVEALRAQGLEVKWVNLATLRRWTQWLGRSVSEAMARRVVRSFRPDLIFVFCRDLPLPLLKEFGREARTVLWTEEALEDLEERHVRYFRAADLVCMSNPGRFPILREHGLENMAFLMSGFSPRYHYPLGPRPAERDLAFIGGPGRHGQRAEFLLRLADHNPVAVFGQGWDAWMGRNRALRVHGPVRPHAYRRICATSRIVLGLNEVNAEPLYFSNRTWLSLACGAFHLTHYVPGLETVFQDGVHLAWYRSFEECLDKARYYLAHEAARTRVAMAGAALALERHTYSHRMAEVLRLLGARAPERAPSPETAPRPRGVEPASRNGSLRPLAE
ncbi:MAG: glycosyltransferase family 1 protein [Planctomycetes bacterium]|nr:glycosyltransferase family 1 protein [Planctomycetota bacterium]